MIKMSQKQYILFQIAALALLGTIAIFIYHQRSRPPARKYPRIVFNSCTNLYAVQTGPGLDTGVVYFGEDCAPPMIMPVWMDEHHDSIVVIRCCDTIDHARLGSELTFKDSAGAANAYTMYRLQIILKRGKDSIDRVEENQYIRMKDSMDRAQRPIKQAAAIRSKHERDSIFQCQHTYQ